MATTRERAVLVKWPDGPAKAAFKAIGRASGQHFAIKSATHGFFHEPLFVGDNVTIEWFEGDHTAVVIARDAPQWD